MSGNVSGIEMRRTPRDRIPDYETPGQFCWRVVEGGERRITYNCPRGLGLCGVPVLPARLPNGAGWSWDGNEEQPTLSPSINCVGGCGWHGFIRAGRMEGA